MTKREIDRLIVLLGKASEELELDGGDLDKVGELIHVFEQKMEG